MDDSARAVAWPSKIFTGQDIGTDGRLLGAWAQLPLDDRLPAGWRTALLFVREDFTGGATHFWAFYARPYWKSDMEILGQWGNHIFGKPKGKR